METLTPLQQRVLNSMAGNEDPKRFLGHVEASLRSCLSNTFLGAIRAGITDVDGILVYVRDSYEQRRASRYATAADRDTAERVLEALRVDRKAALECARHYLQWEALPKQQREHVKSEKAAGYRDAYMEQQPATERQVNYLRRLGHTGAVESKAHASRLIDNLLRRKAGAQ